MEVKGKAPPLDAAAHLKKTHLEEKEKISSTQSFEGPAKGDTVVLSPKAKQIAEAKKLLNAVPEIREEKVAQLRKKISKGTYQIDGSKVAAKMVNDVLLNEVLLDKTDEQ